MRIGRDDLGRAQNTHDGTARCRSSTKRAHVWSPIATRRAERRIIPATTRDRVVGLLPRHDLEQLRPGLDARRLEPGNDELGVAGAGQHQHRQPFERHRLVAGEVRQVGPDREQQRVDAELGHARRARASIRPA